VPGKKVVTVKWARMAHIGGVLLFGGCTVYWLALYPAKRRQ